MMKSPLITSLVALSLASTAISPAFAQLDPAAALKTYQQVQQAQQVQSTVGQVSDALGNAPKAKGGLFGCSASGDKQEIGGGVGAVVGGVVGNRVAGSGNRTMGTLLGAALGGAAGAWVGCKLQHKDQVKAQQAAQRAAEQGRSQTWASADTGASGSATVRNVAQNTDLSALQFAPGVQPANGYTGNAASYTTLKATSIRSAPSAKASALGLLPKGTTFLAPAAVQGAPWVLVSQNGVGKGYVPKAGLKASTAVAVGSCRTVHNTIQAGDNQPATEDYRACLGADGKWAMTRV